MSLMDSLTPYHVFVAGTVLLLAIMIRTYLKSRKEYELLQDLSSKVEVYNRSIDAYEEGVLILSHNNDVLFVNQEFGDYFEISEKEISKKFLNNLTLVNINDPSKRYNFLDAVDRKKYISDVTIPQMPHKAPIKISSNLFRSSEEDETYWRVIVMHDLSEYYRLQKQIQKTQSYNDLLTDLPVQGMLMGDLVDANLRSNLHGTSIILSFFGIRHFASQRSLLGYEKTNHMIRTAAEFLKQRISENEKLYYRGRGDFAIIIADSDDPDKDIREIKTRLSNIREQIFSKGFDITFSQAIMHLNADKRSPDTIIDRCHEMQLDSEKLDKVMFEDSTNEITPQNKIPLSRSKEHVFSRSDFSNAIQRKEFFSFYQPIFDLQSNRLIGAEYLMRWNHPRYGLLSASDFLDKAVKLDILTEITDYLLENVLSHKASWDNFGLGDFSLSINFAMPELRIANFAEKLERKLNEHAIDAETITVDISEKLLSEDISIIREEVETLKKLGVRIAMDSFGEGFTHLKFLEELPFDTIKIDGSLIQGIEINPDKRKLVSAIIAMGKGLGVTVGATHIDNKSILDTLIKHGCDYGQGYYFSKALPFFEMLNFIKSHLNTGEFYSSPKNL